MNANEEKADALITNVATPGDELNQPLHPIKVKTFAGKLKFQIESKIAPLAARDPNHPALENPKWLASMLDPWPEWVLRIATEVISVYFPRVKKRSIFKTLKFFHFIGFEMEAGVKIEDSQELQTKLQKHFDLFDFPSDAMAEVISCMAHVKKHAEVHKVRLEEAKAKSEMWSENEEKNLQQTKSGYDQIAKQILTFLNSEPPEDHTPTMETIVAADKATYDKHGRIRYTTATNVYKQILRSWPKVQNFNDERELCDFLDPVLGHGDADAKLDRVKKIVKRMGIKFRPRQGTRPK